MKTGKIGLFVAVAASVMMMVGCGDKGGSTAPQKEPAVQAQNATPSRGVKIEREECEAEALKSGTSPRESGSAIAPNESFAVNLALLDARAKLAQQLKTLVTGAVENFNQQYSKKEGGSSYVNKASQVQQSYYEQFLQNTRPFCKNTYVKDSGDYEVWVAVEILENDVNKIHQQMTKDDMLDTDFKEHQFKESMKEMREKYIEANK
jgi:hypothetical protein